MKNDDTLGMAIGVGVLLTVALLVGLAPNYAATSYTKPSFYKPRKTMNEWLVRYDERYIGHGEWMWHAFYEDDKYDYEASGETKQEALEALRTMVLA